MKQPSTIVPTTCAECQFAIPQPVRNPKNPKIIRCGLKLGNVMLVANSTRNCLKGKKK